MKDRDNTWRRLFAGTMALSLVLSLGVHQLHAQASFNVPERMSYQGYISDADGNPLGMGAPSNHEMLFTIYDSSAGGTGIWSEQQIVTVDNGYFNVMLGEGTLVSGTTLSAAFTGPSASERFIAVEVEVEVGQQKTPIEPRARLLPGSYAFLAANALSSELAKNATLANKVPASGIQGTVALNQLPTSLTDAAWTASGGNIYRSAGNVGIGTTTPGARLDVAGQGRFQGLLLPGSFGPDPSYVGTTGNSISFGHGGSSEDFIGYKHNTFYMADSPGGTDNAEPNLVVTGHIQANGSFLVPNKQALVFGQGISKGNVDNGTIGYQRWTRGLDIIGAGSSIPEKADGTDRLLTLWGQVTVRGGVRAQGGAPGAGGVNNRGYAFEGSGGDADSGMFSTTDGQIDFYSNSAERMTLKDDYLTLNANIRLKDINNSSRTATLFRSSDGFKIEMAGSSFHNDVDLAFWDGDSDWNFTSDRRLKKDITDAEPVLSRLMELQVRRYRWKSEAPEASPHFGVVAQEVQPLFPDLIGTHTDDEGTQLLNVGYAGFGLIAAKALQEFKVESDTRQAELQAAIVTAQGDTDKALTRVASLEEENETLRTTIERQEQRIAALEEKAQARAASFTALEKLVRQTLSTPQSQALNSGRSE